MLAQEAPTRLGGARNMEKFVVKSRFWNDNYARYGLM